MIRVGTAGWSIPRDHAARVPEGESALARYAQVLDYVEINSSFWRRHQPKTWERWARTVPAGFRFGVKLPREVTHLGDPSVLPPFFEEIAGLGEKLAAVLVQLPPKLAFDARAAKKLFALLRKHYEGDVACEPRHASWFTPEADALLRALHVARVAADPPRAPGGDAPGGDPSFSYHRLHGSPRMYRSPYTDRLPALAKALRGRGYCVFDNTASGAALGDALDLKARL